MMSKRLSALFPSTAGRQRAAPQDPWHRPWPLPRGPWMMGQTWERLLFAHWPVAAEELRPVVPASLPIDLFQDAAWIGITPFEVRGLRLRGAPPLPGVSRFPELNVRTYVTIDGKAGIYFLSLDAASALAVAAARRIYRLPYFRARMAVTDAHGWIDYRSRRTRDPTIGFSARYRPVGEVFRPVPGSLEHWLTERYCLYTLDDEQKVLRGEIHHPPWLLNRAEAEIRTNTLTTPLQVQLREAPLLHFAQRQDVVFWPLATRKA